MLKLYSILYYTAVLCSTLCIFVLISVAHVVCTPFDKQRKILHRISRLWTKVFFIFLPGSKIKVDGLENIDPNGTYVITVNHQSMIDIPLMYVLPLNFKWVAKKEVYKIPIFGWVMRMHGDIGIDRASSKSMQKLMSEGHKWMGAGTSVIIFPEGTRTKNGDLSRFKEGAFLLAKSSEVGILPCVIEGSRSSIIGWIVQPNNIFKVRVLPPISVETVSSTNTKELAAMVQQMTSEAYEQMRK